MLLPAGDLVRASGRQGWLGVEVFFVISGFVIPFALNRSSYKFSDYGVFLLKRIVRLDPPYIVAVVLIVCLGYASSHTVGFQGSPFHPTVPQLLLHLAYLNVFFGYDWLNPVFWTLAIEFQYYLLIGLIFPLLVRLTDWKSGAFVLLIALLSFLIPAERFIVHWIPLFLLGAVTFSYRSARVSHALYVTLLALLGAIAVLSHGLLVSSVSLAAACVIAFAPIPRLKPLLFFGSISYPLYLLHVPIGGRAINLAARFCDTRLERLVALVVALAASIAAAWLMHLIVERPAQRWSASIGYKKAVAPTGFGPRNG